MTNIVSRLMHVFCKLRYKVASLRDQIMAVKELRRCRKAYPDFIQASEFDCGTYKFIWGVKSPDEQSSVPASLRTLNDIGIVFDRRTRHFILDIETAYWFDESKETIEFLQKLLDYFTSFMDEQGYNKDAPYDFWMSQPSALFEEETIPGLYTSFRIFVEGYTKIHTEDVART